MRTRTLALLIAFVVGVVIGAAAAVSAQSSSTREVQVFTVPADAVKASAANTDVAVRIVGRRNGRVVGHLMARVDGKWVEVQLATENVLATP